VAATPTVTTQKYINPETTKIYWVPSIADILAPTRLELDAGTDLVLENAASEGWNVTSNQVPVPNMGRKFTGSIPGRITAEDSSLDMYASIDGIDARALMSRDEEGNIVWLDGGDVAGRLMDVFPVQVSSVTKSNRSVEGEEAQMLKFSYSITEEPAENVLIPA